ncbi:MAG: metallophosphoesterase [Bacteroidaceae bacterium]|nr:metallophosphoesterase [Bacteroidaceae bacterium]
MKRRDFIRHSAMMAGVASLANHPLTTDASVVPSSIDNNPTSHSDQLSPLITSAPMLQNYAETSMGVAFAVSDLANGYVIFGRQPDLSDGQRVKCGGYRTTDISDRVIQVRLTHLQPGTTYYYKIGADRIHYGGGYDMKIIDTVEDPNIYHFTTAGPQVPSHFCVINDTHARWSSFDLVVNKVAALAPQCVIWNGDACNVEETIEAQMQIFLQPKIKRTDYAAEVPYLFCPGNHDSRGMANRHLERVWMYRQPEERLSRDWDLGRNFAVRMGEVALIGLDTAEDKLDTNPLFAGLFSSGPYREAQVAWLEDALQRPEIASAPYLVACCHIPLFDKNPRSNPGDVAPADKDARYETDFAAWQRTCAQLWSPLLEKAGCQLVITAHQHRYHCDAATPERPWAHVVGGGPDLNSLSYPTVIEGNVQDGQLLIKVHNLFTGQLQDILTFSPRRS